jgi:hypothetical protein
MNNILAKTVSIKCIRTDINNKLEKFVEDDINNKLEKSVEDDINNKLEKSVEDDISNCLIISDKTRSLIKEGAKLSYQFWLQEDTYYENYIKEIEELGGLNFRYYIKNSLIYQDRTDEVFSGIEERYSLFSIVKYVDYRKDVTFEIVYSGISLKETYKKAKKLGKILIFNKTSDYDEFSEHVTVINSLYIFTDPKYNYYNYSIVESIEE